MTETTPWTEVARITIMKKEETVTVRDRRA